jgi:hypothetical protein
VWNIRGKGGESRKKERERGKRKKEGGDNPKNQGKNKMNCWVAISKLEIARRTATTSIGILQKL